MALDGGLDLVRSLLQTKQISLSTQREPVSCMAMFAAQLVQLPPRTAFDEATTDPLPPTAVEPPPTNLYARVLHLGHRLRVVLLLLPALRETNSHFTYFPNHYL